MEIMMEKIWQMLPAIGRSKFKNDTFFHNVLLADFGRSVSWLREFAHETHADPYVGDKQKKSKRPALF